ncbi:MAG: response regulator [Desulfobacula sp.]|jgi:PAS domain S-box-containing protein|uniref:ATP-binding response regulator n=2 Tax=Desulfobacula sp. TaxID=2593537 RepID=UPI001D66D80C|nr:response regulator [Desulfobacula sp.]MBT3487809.1 response regulator [Desulfobacula sp.]MBT3805508.1 response regulator [Desulfobacula sp.]MBT4025904.1 response regulator [Desulfobacula sp.]MBT4199132.1 response regulator [Desulfobacula sp.]
MSANKILIVDDEEIIVKLLSMSLRSDGYETVTAHSGEQGLEVFKSELPDIVVTDIKMPGMDGLELLKKIKEIDSEKEVIIVTGHGDIDSTITALQYGASDFINKPVRDEALAIALERAKAKIAIREKLEEYTENLEIKIAEATEEIRRKSNFQRLLIKSSNDAIVAFDHDWKVVVYNPEAANMFGEAVKDVRNKMTIDDLYTPKIAKIFKNQAKEEKQQNTLPWRENIINTKDGRQIPVRYTSNVLYKKGEFVGTVSFFQDLTEIKRLEKELVQSERLAAVGQTVSGLAHYVKNILIGLKGGSYVVDVGIKKNNTDKLKTGWESIKKNIKRVGDLTQDLLTYSKQREPEFEVCMPNDIAADVIQLVEDFAGANGVLISKEFDTHIGEIVADPQTIHRSLLNLMNNAIDACMDDEDVSKKHEVKIKTYKDENNYFCFEVKDNGCGMDEDIQKQLFNPMFSSKGGKGTGLGLLVTGKLIEEHKGVIETETSQGIGSTFRIKLPLEKANAVDKV